MVSPTNLKLLYIPKYLRSWDQVIRFMYRRILDHLNPMLRPSSVNELVYYIPYHDHVNSVFRGPDLCLPLGNSQ